MEMKVAATCMHWSQPAVTQSQSSQALASAIPSPSSSKRRRNRKDAALVCHVIHGSNRSALFGRTSCNLSRTVSCEIPKSRSCSHRRAASASLDSFSDEEFAENIRELALRFQLSNDEPQSENEEDHANSSDSRNTQAESSSSGGGGEGEHYNSFNGSGNIGFTRGKISLTEPSWLRIRPEPPYEAIPASVERKANSVDLPLSLRILQKKTQWTDEFREAGESAYCSVRKAFSSMVFMIRELQSYTIQMREFLFFEDVQGIIDRVQKEMNASFVWLFQQIFSHTPTLMMYVMILMANFTVHSMSSNAALAATPPTMTVEYCSTTTETVSSFENKNQNPSLDSSQIKSFSDSSSSGKTISVGGNSGGGGKVKPIGSGTDGGDGRFDGVSSIHHHTIVPDELSQVSSFGNPTTSQEEEELVEQVSINEETQLWNIIVQEASKMQAAMMDESLDHETMQKFVSPIIAEIEPEDYLAYSRTELKYQEAVSEEPNNALLLSNYAQFLYLVVHDHDRAEEYFKRASQVKPRDAEALSKYASFLWMARKEINAAEETYLEAIEADPGNAFYAANYANFLWNTGGEDTCYPL